MKIVLTMGDPNGIGIEVLVKSLQALFDAGGDFKNMQYDITGNLKTIEEYISKMRLRAQVDDSNLIIDGKKCRLIDTGEYAPVRFGCLSKSGGKLSADSIEKAVGLTIDKKYDAVVTMPVSKEALYRAGWKYPGHTEMLADRCGIERPIMILLAGELRVALLTIHEPISVVPQMISKELILKMARMYEKSLIQDFAVENPKIALLGLNPHAGENGSIGNEEEVIMKPAINLCNVESIDISGPFPSDGFFAHGDYQFYDGILASYHDQGLIPLKLIAQGSGVNYTVGLPIVRTSVDHGTAFSIAGKDKADFRSAVEAIKTAALIAGNRKKFDKNNE